jgi:hypothetical protein
MFTALIIWLIYHGFNYGDVFRGRAPVEKIHIAMIPLAFVFITGMFMIDRILFIIIYNSFL